MPQRRQLGCEVPRQAAGVAADGGEAAQSADQGEAVRRCGDADERQRTILKSSGAWAPALGGVGGGEQGKVGGWMNAWMEFNPALPLPSAPPPPLTVNCPYTPLDPVRVCRGCEHGASREVRLVGSQEAQRIPAHHQRPETGRVPASMESRDLLGAGGCKGFRGRAQGEGPVNRSDWAQWGAVRQNRAC